MESPNPEKKRDQTAAERMEQHLDGFSRRMHYQFAEMEERLPKQIAEAGERLVAAICTRVEPLRVQMTAMEQQIEEINGRLASYLGNLVMAKRSLEQPPRRRE